MVKAIFQAAAVIVALVAVGLAALTRYAKQFQVDPPTLAERGLTCENKPGLCGPVSAERAPDVITTHGRWRKAALAPNVGNEWDVQFKRWSYFSVSDEKYFVAGALVKFYYISDVFFYVVDKTTNEYLVYSGRLPLGVGLDAAVSSVNGCASWGNPTKNFKQAKGSFIELCGNDMQGLRLRARVPLISVGAKPPKVKITMLDIQMKNFEDLILAYPLGGDDKRLVYVHKVAGMPVAKESYIEFDGVKHTLQEASGGLDWTKGKLLYRTFWRWASLNDARAEVTRGNNPSKREYLGINLSQDVYDVLKPNGEVFSSENAIWLSGRVYPLNNPVEITVPADPKKDLWTIKSIRPTEDENVDLLFRPYGAREDFLDAGPILSDFTQPYGRFSGAITVKDPKTGELVIVSVKEDTAFGVVENHRAYW